MSANGVPYSASLTHQTAQRLQKIASSDVSQQLKEKASLAILDYLGAIASGLQAPWAPSVCSYGRARKGISESHAWGIQVDTNAETAAWVNATLAHSAIRDDMHLKSNSHIGSIIISAALALAQRDHWSGEQLLKAIIGGYEAAALLGVAVQQSPGYNRHARPSGICGAFGAAAAAVTANLVSSKITEDVAVNALGFAANMSSGFNEWAWAGGVEIYTEMGTASQSGIVAFDISRSGMQCSETILEGRAGVFAALSASDGEKLFRQGLQGELGNGIMAVRFKPVPGCNYAQTPLATALNLSHQHKLSFDDIKSITMTCTRGAKNYPGCDNPGPFENVQQTKMSIQFGVSAVLLQGEVSENLFKRFDDKQIETLARDCVVQAGMEFDEAFSAGRQPARLEVKLSNGEQVTHELIDVPWLDANAVLSRFHAEAGNIMTSEKARKAVVSAAKELGTLSDAAELFGLFKDVAPLGKT